MSTRIAPAFDPDSTFFWDGVKRHELLVQRCGECGALRHPPRPMCPTCNSLSWEAIPSAGRGTVYSFVMPQHPQFPMFEYPYIVALIELDEGVRIISNLCDVAPADAYIGMPVEVFYADFENELVLPQFRPASQGKAEG